MEAGWGVRPLTLFCHRMATHLRPVGGKAPWEVGRGLGWTWSFLSSLCQPPVGILELAIQSLNHSFLQSVSQSVNKRFLIISRQCPWPRSISLDITGIQITALPLPSWVPSKKPPHLPEPQFAYL